MTDLQHRADALIHADGLAKTYGKGAKAVRALDDVGFTVPSGSVFGLLGPNGAGKTTTVKILTTLSRPDSGRAIVAGVDVTRDPAGVRRLIGYVPQKSCFDPIATGRENLVLQGRVYGMPTREVRQRADELLGRFGIADAANRRAGTWSGGMQRKLDVAMGLIHRPRVLFLDEPTTGLDPEARAEMWDEIARLSTVDGMTVLLTTHYLDEADRLADAIAIVDRGRVVAAGTPQGLKSELAGDAIVVELPGDGDPGRARDAIRAVRGVHDVTVHGATLRARVTDGPTSLPGLFAALEAVHLSATSVTVSRPSLDDVYLRHAGRTFRAAETSGPDAETTVQAVAS